jgi:ribonuclease VapC
VILDTSVLLAILFGEADASKWLKGISEHRIEGLYMSVANYLEAVLRVDSFKDPSLVANLDELIAILNIQLEPVSNNQTKIAREANLLFGKNAPSKAKLNFGDLFAYALAKELRKPLLYKGNDFSHTEILSYRFDLV